MKGSLLLETLLLHKDIFLSICWHLTKQMKIKKAKYQIYWNLNFYCTDYLKCWIKHRDFWFLLPGKTKLYVHIFIFSNFRGFKSYYLNENFPVSSTLMGKIKELFSETFGIISHGENVAINKTFLLILYYCFTFSCNLSAISKYVLTH